MPLFSVLQHFFNAFVQLICQFQIYIYIYDQFLLNRDQSISQFIRNISANILHA